MPQACIGELSAAICMSTGRIWLNIRASRQRTSSKPLAVRAVGAGNAHRHPAPVWLLLPENDLVVKGAGGKQATKLWMGPSHLHSMKTAWATYGTA